MKIEKTILFDGTSTDGWTNKDGSPIDWKIDEEGALVVGSGFKIYKLNSVFFCKIYQNFHKTRADAFSPIFF